MIKKLGQFEDTLLNRQIDEIIANQSGKNKEVEVHFDTASTTEKINVGGYYNRFRVVWKKQNMDIWAAEDPDNFYNYLQSSATGTAVLEFWTAEDADEN